MAIIDVLPRRKSRVLAKNLFTIIISVIEIVDISRFKS